jgi:aryl-alcohol dehydrogenase-like predicted oxidoreductase
MIEQMEFGRTGHRSTRTIFGAAALSRMSQERAEGLLATLLEFGVNHIDTAAAYGDSELRLAPWLSAHPDRFFLATKTGDRTATGARASLERSLTRLGVDRVDLIQCHNLVEEDEWETAFGPGGAIEGLAAAREEGLTRFIGVTGHGLRIAGMHLRSLERFDFDSVLLPYSYVLWRNEDYRAAASRLLQVCAERRVAVQTIKAVARRRWDDGSNRHFSWYEPVDPNQAGDAFGRAVGWVLSNPQVFLNTSSDGRLLRPTLEMAAGGGPAPAESELEADLRDLAIEPLFDGSELERI